MKRILVAIIGVLSACLGDPVGPRGALLLRVVDLDTATTVTGAPGRALPAPLVFEVRDDAGRPIAGARVLWSLSGTGAAAHSTSQVTDRDGQFHANWVLGTNALEPQRLTADVSIGAHMASVTIKAWAVPVEIADLRVLAETTLVRLGASGSLPVTATDPFGNLFLPSSLRVISLDSLVAGVDSALTLQGRRRGYARVAVEAEGRVDTAWVHVTQIVREVRVDLDTIQFHSLGQVRTFEVALWDDLGNLVADSTPVAEIIGSPVAEIQPGAPFQLRSIVNGNAQLVLRAGPVMRDVALSVWQRPAKVRVEITQHAFDALMDTLHLQANVLDSLSMPVPDAVPGYLSTDTAVAMVTADGRVVSVGNGSALIIASVGSDLADTSVVAVNQRVVRIEPSTDSLKFESLLAEWTVTGTPRDRLGARVLGASVLYQSGDATIATVSPSGVVRAVRNGTTQLTVRAATESATVTIEVAQRPVRVVHAQDTVRFVALHDTVTIAASAVDSLGSLVTDVIDDLLPADSSIVNRVGTLGLRSTANGTTNVALSVGGLAGLLPIVVRQVADSVDAGVTFPKAIVTVSVGTTLPLDCRAFDHNGFMIPDDVPFVASSSGTVTGTGCGNLQAQRSGFDTLTFAQDAAQVRVPIVVAITPVAPSLIGQFAVADTLPGQPGQTWSPSVHRGPNGELEVYYTVYSGVVDSSGFTRGDLHRLIWTGGNNFRYDGIAVSHDDDICSPQGQGIENMAVVPRADGVGWRMLYAAGSNVCYGWQVFSAVSADGRTWTKEPGIRLSNGGTIHGPTQWPVGEGMVVYQGANGVWEMIVGGYEQLTPMENKWQIVRWQSTDQLQWNYIGPVLTTRDMPVGWQGSVYSPTVKEVAPGLWRMLFTADGRGTPGGRSAIWSAVSTDRQTWQIEGEVLGDASANLYYAALADDLVAFIRQDNGGTLYLSVASVTMP